jgi:DNA processing protein
LRAVEGIGHDVADQIVHWENIVDLPAELERIRQFGAHVITAESPLYPRQLREIHAPPIVLYVWGELTERDQHAIAVIGSRRTTHYGMESAKKLSYQLAYAGLTVISGLARGIDTAAHQGALDAQGRTVAVLGCGIDRVYPPENAALARAIEARGALVSEFALGTPPLPHHFPRRNRVIAGWSRGVVVVEAARRSGSLNTARTAVDEGRDVMAVPGHPSQPACEGTNQLLRDGAVLVRNARDVAEELGFELPEAGSEAGQPSADPVLGALRPDAPSSLDDLRARSGLETPELLARLSQLELRDEVRRLPGALFVRHH